MGFWKNLFGGSGSEPKVEAPAPGEDYKGYSIRATPMPLGGEYQLAGEIRKDIGGETKTYKFVRADRMSSREDCVNMAVAKGKLIVDEQGDSMFTSSWPKAN